MNRAVYALAILIASSTGSLRAAELKKEGAFWEKSPIAKGSAPHGCFYAIVTDPVDGHRGMTPTLYFKRQDGEGKSAALGFRHVRHRFTFGNEGGDVLEACVSPGSYALVSIVYSAGVYGAGAYHAEYDVMSPPLSFEVTEGKNYYLGHFSKRHGDPHYFVYTHALERDTALIRQHAKRPPASEMEVVSLPVGYSRFLRAVR